MYPTLDGHPCPEEIQRIALYCSSRWNAGQDFDAITLVTQRGFAPIGSQLGSTDSRSTEEGVNEWFASNVRLDQGDVVNMVVVVSFWTVIRITVSRFYASLRRRAAP